jgi:hypothetical protein
MAGQPLAAAPQQVQAEALARGLGSRFSTYEVSAGRVAGAAVMATFAAVLGVLMTVGAFASGGFFYFLALVVDAVAVYYVVTAVRVSLAVGERVYLFDGGLVHTGSAGTRTFIFTEVEVLRNVHTTTSTWSSSTTLKYTVTRADGARVLLDTNTFAEIASLGPKIEARVTKARLPLAWTAVARGESVQFGPISVDSHGLTFRGNAIPWPQITGIELYNGDVRIRRSGGRNRSCPISSVPNVFVLAAVAEGLRSRIT